MQNIFRSSILVSFFVLALTAGLFSFIHSSQALTCEGGYKPVNGLCIPESGTGSGGISGANNVNELIEKVITALLGVAFAIAVLFIIIGGFWYMTSAGNENQARKGRDTLLYALLGTIVIIMSYVIVSFVVVAVS
jgi:hypothetical protein